jgi:MFS family permease
LFAIREIRIYIAGQSLSMLGDSALWLGVAVWAKTLTGSNSAAGLVFLALVLGRLLAPLSGLLADRVRRRPLLVATNVATAPVIVLLLLVHDSGRMWLVYLVMFGYGLSNSLIGPAQAGLLATAVPADLLVEANAALLTIREALQVFAPLLGVGVLGWLGPGALVVGDAVTFLLAAAGVLQMRVAERAPAPGRGRWWFELAAGARHVRQAVVLRQLVVAVGLLLIVFGFGETVQFAVVGTGLDRAPTFLGVLVAAQGVGAIVGGPTTGPVVRRLGEGLAVAAGLAAFAAGCVLLAVPWLGTVLAGSVLCGLAVPWVLGATMAAMQRLTPGELRGRVFAVFNLLANGPQALSIAVGAALTTVADYRVLLVTMAVVVAGAASYLMTRPEQRPVPQPEASLAAA